MNDQIPLPDCARHLARLWPTMPAEMRPYVSKLREQCRNYELNPEGLRPKILQTIDAIENAA